MSHKPISLALTPAQAGYLADVVDFWLAYVEDAKVIDPDVPSDVEFLNFIRDLRSRLEELTI